MHHKQRQGGYGNQYSKGIEERQPAAAELVFLVERDAQRHIAQHKPQR